MSQSILYNSFSRRHTWPQPSPVFKEGFIPVGDLSNPVYVLGTLSPFHKKLQEIAGRGADVFIGYDTASAEIGFSKEIGALNSNELKELLQYADANNIALMVYKDALYDPENAFKDGLIYEHEDDYVFLTKAEKCELRERDRNSFLRMNGSDEALLSLLQPFWELEERNSDKALMVFENGWSPNSVSLQEFWVWDRGQGTGSRLLKETIELCDEQNVSCELVADSLHCKHDRLVSLYSSFGFCITGDVDVGHMIRPMPALRNEQNINTIMEFYKFHKQKKNVNVDHDPSQLIEVDVDPSLTSIMVHFNGNDHMINEYKEKFLEIASLNGSFVEMLVNPITNEKSRVCIKSSSRDNLQP